MKTVSDEQVWKSRFPIETAETPESNLVLRVIDIYNSMESVDFLEI